MVIRPSASLPRFTLRGGGASGKSRPIRKPIQGPIDLPLSGVSKSVLFYAAEEADRFSSKHIGTEHLLLGLLREEHSLAAEFLHERGVRLASTREELMRIPHSYSATEESGRPAFVLDVTSPLHSEPVTVSARV